MPANTADSFRANWNYPTTIRFGPGRVSELADLAREVGMQRPLLVTDRGTACLPLAEEVRRVLEETIEYDVFADIAANPTGEQIIAGAAAFRRGAHDGIIALGGGSGLDAGKTIAFCALQKRSLWDFEDVGENWRRASSEHIRPCIAVPTTAGTGSEVGRAAVILDTDTRRKTIIFHPRMMPVAVLSDPLLTCGLPPGLTAATGLDAFTHCFEAFCATGFHPMADGVALAGMGLIKDWLPVAYRNGSDVEARSHMLAAASMGATAFQKGLGAVHAMSHPVGAFYGSHHGLTNAVFLPFVMQRNRAAIEEPMHRLGQFLALPQPGFDSVHEWLLEFLSDLGIPRYASALGVQAADINLLARAAHEDPSAAGNPIPLSVEDYRRLFEQSLG